MGQPYGYLDGQMANALNAILVRRGADVPKRFSDKTEKDIDNASTRRSGLFAKRRGNEMSKLMRTATCVFVLFACGRLTRAQGWRGIVPLHSNRQDVERVVSVPAEPNGITYVLKDERVNVLYSKDKCGKGPGVEWDVPPDTVLGIIAYPQVKLLLSDVRADLDGFEKFVHPRGPDVVYDNNDREGISFGTRSGRGVRNRVLSYGRH